MTDQKHTKELEDWIRNKDFETRLEKLKCKECDGLGWNTDCDDELTRVECQNCGGSGKASSGIDINSLYDIIKKLTKQRDELIEVLEYWLPKSVPLPFSTDKASKNHNEKWQLAKDFLTKTKGDV